MGIPGGRECSLERANLKTDEKRLLTDPDQEKEDTLSCGGSEMYSMPTPLVQKAKLTSA